jgi:hypothetical protein
LRCIVSNYKPSDWFCFGGSHAKRFTPTLQVALHGIVTDGRTHPVYNGNDNDSLLHQMPNNTVHNWFQKRPNMKPRTPTPAEVEGLVSKAVLGFP